MNTKGNYASAEMEKPVPSPVKKALVILGATVVSGGLGYLVGMALSKLVS